MANKDDYKRAIDAVQAGQADAHQRELAAKAAQQAGSMGNDARAAMKGQKKW